MVKPRHKKFLEALPRHGNKVLPSAIEAGYSLSYAQKNPAYIVKSAINAQAKDIQRAIKEDTMTSKQLEKSVIEISGYSTDDVIGHYRYVVEQEKDMSAKLKALSPLLKSLGINLSQDDEAKTINVPILNLSFGNKENKPIDNNIVEHKPTDTDTV